jgi:hypothetical protein
VDATHDPRTKLVLQQVDYEPAPVELLLEKPLGLPELRLIQRLNEAAGYDLVQLSRHVERVAYEWEHVDVALEKETLRRAEQDGPVR